MSFSSKLFLISLLGIVSAGGVTAKTFSLTPGKGMPVLTLAQARDGQPERTDTYLGKKTVVHIFASW